MNKDRRERLSQAIEMIEEIITEEEEALENLPENIRESEKGEALEENINCMRSAVEEIEQVTLYSRTRTNYKSH
jgi:vacuolar-type H+-ATPase subunit H